MGSAVLKFLVSGSGRRLMAFLLTTGLTALNKKLGLNMDIPELVALITGGVTYVIAGNVKEASMSDAVKAALASKPAA